MGWDELREKDENPYVYVFIQPTTFVRVLQCLQQASTESHSDLELRIEGTYEFRCAPKKGMPEAWRDKYDTEHPSWDGLYGTFSCAEADLNVEFSIEARDFDEDEPIPPRINFGLPANKKDNNYMRGLIAIIKKADEALAA